jgi:sulfur carrier protein
MIEVTINGEKQTLSGIGTVAQLVESLGMTGRRIAVERNGEIVPKSRHANEPIAPGDRFEVVVAVGGG